jgi:hypothetical protein
MNAISIYSNLNADAGADDARLVNNCLDFMFRKKGEHSLACDLCSQGVRLLLYVDVLTGHWHVRRVAGKAVAAHQAALCRS